MTSPYNPSVRLAIVGLVGGVLLAVYTFVVASSTSPRYVDPDAVEPQDLKAIMPPETLPVGFKLAAEDVGRRLWAPGSEDEVAYGSWLFIDDAGNRIAVSITATGTGATRTGLRYARDALCSKSWPNSDCDPQFNSSQYVETEPLRVGERSVGSSRESASGRSIRNDTFVRAGMEITLSIESEDESSFEAVAILRALDLNAIAFARDRGVAIPRSALAKR